MESRAGFFGPWLTSFGPLGGGAKWFQLVPGRNAPKRSDVSVNFVRHQMGVSPNNGTPKSSILIGLSIINHPFWGTTIFGNTQIP